MEIGLIHKISFFKRTFPTRRPCFWVDMNVQSASENLFSMERIRKQEVSLTSLKVYLSKNIKYACVITKGSICINEFRNAKYCESSMHLWGHGSQNSRAWPRYVSQVSKIGFRCTCMVYFMGRRAESENSSNKKEFSPPVLETLPHAPRQPAAMVQTTLGMSQASSSASWWKTLSPPLNTAPEWSPGIDKEKFHRM